MKKGVKPKKPLPQESTDEIDEKRTNRVLELFIEHPEYLGETGIETLQTKIAREFKLKPPQVTALIEAARTKFDESVAGTVEEKRVRAILQRNMLIERARDQGDLKVVLMAMKERDLLEGVNFKGTTGQTDEKRRYTKLEDLVRDVFGMVYTAPVPLPTTLVETPSA